MEKHRQFLWFLLNSIVVCVAVMPVATFFWLSVFAAGFSWVEWLNLMEGLLDFAIKSPDVALGKLHTYWGIFSIFALAAYGTLFKFRRGRAVTEQAPSPQDSESNTEIPAS